MRAFILLFGSRLIEIVYVAANVEAGTGQRIDMEILDGSSHRNVYQNKRGLAGETRMAITTHADADLGVCFKNTLDSSRVLHFNASGVE